MPFSRLYTTVKKETKFGIKTSIRTNLKTKLYQSVKLILKIYTKTL